MCQVDSAGKDPFLIPEGTQESSSGMQLGALMPAAVVSLRSLASSTQPESSPAVGQA
jgi:hypothetical protein